jgi:hypothetical protein
MPVSFLGVITLVINTSSIIFTQFQVVCWVEFVQHKLGDPLRHVDC